MSRQVIAAPSAINQQPANPPTPPANVTSHSPNDAPQYPRLAPGYLIRVWNGLNRTYEDYSSEDVYVTYGSGEYLDYLVHRGQLIYREHCKSFLRGSCPWGETCTFIHVVSTAVGVTTPCIRVYDGPPGCYVDYPIDYIIPTVGSRVYLESGGKIGGSQLCRNLLYGSCSFAERCHFIHLHPSKTLKGSTHADKHKGAKLPANPKTALCRYFKQVARSGQQPAQPCPCPAAHSYSELVPPPGALRLLPSGFFINVFDSDTHDTHQIPTEKILHTRGADEYMKAVRESGKLLGRELCATFKQFGKCEFWDKCMFLHVTNR
eukprot:TRINITY_DN6661_c0_g1_i1.p1 TRINITY_DN6661_c0_g1~~TRINITY_DN6661_c0_g1_i1.p1  ORF type:complete len:319 (-),score=21.72 TRINITY_DN6661_c0_g1_i1:801-1757(-)